MRKKNDNWFLRGKPSLRTIKKRIASAVESMRLEREKTMTAEEINALALYRSRVKQAIIFGSKCHENERQWFLRDGSEQHFYWREKFKEEGDQAYLAARRLPNPNVLFAPVIIDPRDWRGEIGSAKVDPIEPPLTSS